MFMSLLAGGLAPEGALAQYIPPPASQTYAPAQGVSVPAATGGAPAAASGESRHSSRSASRHHRKASRTRVVEETVTEEAAPHKSRHSGRKSRAERRAEAREAARERRAAAAEAKADAASSSTDDDTPAQTKASGGIVILSGEPQSTIARGAEEIAALGESAGLEITPRTGRISLAELSNPEGAADADLAILQSDALEEARRDGGPALTRKLTFIARLFNQEIHIVARQGVKNFADLNGRTVATSAPDTPEGRTAAKLFERAGLHPRLVEMDPQAALSRLSRGEIDAAIFVGGKPIPAIADMPVAGLKLVSIPYKGALQDAYYPAQISKSDYPNLVTGPNGVDTVAIGTVLVALDAKPGSPRYKKLTQFTDTFFSKFGALREGAHHPKWREVNLAADVPGWRRFQPAQKWLDHAPAPRVSSAK